MNSRQTEAPDWQQSGVSTFCSNPASLYVACQDFINTLLIAILAGVGFIIAYHTYGRWLGGRNFNLAASQIAPRID